ncbi:MAG: leucine-rich repeat domain-containing protein, partial [Bacteroidaceae bacterium]|nr:leucine-rich repeat domain-containing protein [Bacteroidaceae bacterium]
IGEYAFSECSGLSSITIPELVTSIEKNAFYNCSNLHSVSIPNSVTSIGDNAFSGCSIMVIYCEASFKPSEWSGSWNSSNRQVTWSSSYVVDGDFIFSDTEKTLLMEYNGKGGDVIIPDGVTLILENVFRDRTDITSVTMPESFKSIKSNAFRGCRNLKSINIPNKFRWFGWGAFYGCSSLESIYIPDTDNVIDASVFAGCSKLTIYCAASSKPDAWDSNWNPDNRPVVWNAQQVPEETSSKLTISRSGICVIPF